MAGGKARKPVKLLHNGKYTSLEQDLGKGFEEEPSSSETDKARRLFWDPKPQTSRRKLLSSPRPSTANTRKLLSSPKPPTTNTRKVHSNPRPLTTTTPNLLSNPRPMNNEEISQALYSSFFPGWATSTLPRDLQARHLLQEALIPSPLVDDDWDNLKPERKAAWLDILGHISNETRALYNYIRENLPDIDEFIFGGEKEFPSKCKSGLLCNLVKEDTSADNNLYIDSDDEDNVPITMFRKRWITGDFVIPLDPQAGSGQLHIAAVGRALSSAGSSLELRRLSVDNDDSYGFFITNGSLAPLFVNGISIGMNMVAGPLPDFAVIEADHVVFFWWCTLQGITYIPKDLPTVQWSHVSGYGPSKRTLEAVEEYENLNDEAPVVKRPKLNEEHAGTLSSNGRPTRGNGDRINDIQATKETARRNRTAAVGDQTTPQPAKHQYTDGTENSLYSPSTWNNEYRRRMIACNAKAKKADDKDGTPRAAHQIISTQALFEDDVFLPIAAVWYALVKQDIKVAFGTQRLFELARYNPDHGMCYVLSPRILIMPLIFCAELPDLVGETFEHSNSPSTNTIGKNKKQKKQKANLKTKSSPKAVSTSTKGFDLLLSEQPRIFSHCVLVTAEKIISFNYKESVRLTFMNSQQNPENYDQYRQAARNVVRNSQWLNGSPVWNDESWPMIAQQGSGSLTPAISGIHVVLNAWAYMLNIPLAHNPQLKKDFYAEARKLIQLALKGCLDSGTIRAFMQAFEYATCVEQRESNIQKAADGLRHMQTVYMNEPIFNEIIEKLQRNEQGQSTKESDSSSPSGKRGPRNPPVGNPLVPGRDSTTPGKDPPAPPQDPPAPGGEPSASEEDPSGPREDSSGSGGDSPGSGGDPSASGGDSPASPASWEAILDAGIERHTEHFEQQSAEFQSNCTHIESPNNMMDEAVVLAIASFWDGLRRTGTIFGFGTADTFRCNRSEDTVVQGLTAVSGPHPLIIPLLMNEADIHTPPPPKSAKGGTRGKKTAVPKGKGRETDKTSLHHGGIGHFVLAIAERRNNDIVEITVKDSRLGSIRMGKLFNAARGFVTHSGWMGIGPQGNPMPANPIFTSEHYPKVPIQRYGNTCGLYAILNAWAYMLKIPIREARVFDATHNHHKFHATALRLINLALAGFMDSSSIQAFFNVWNYAVQQDVNDLSVHVVRADAQRMDPRILQDRIMEQRDLDQVLALEPPPTEAQITQVTDLGISREMAIRQLKLATNNPQAVAANLTAARSSPGPAGFSKPRDEDIAFVVEVTGFAPESVSAELTRARGDRNKAIYNILDQYKTGNSPTGSRSGSTPHKAGNQTAPPDTGLEHSYDEVDIGRLMSYRDISLNTVLRQLDRAGGDVGKAEERIRHLSNALSSNSGSSQSHHSAANNYGPFDPKLERPHTDADIDEIMAIKHQVKEQVSEERENFAGNVERSRRDMIKGLTQGEKPSSVTNQEEDSELHPLDKSTISERSPTHAETLTSPISTPVTAAQVNPPSVDLPDISTPHENVTPSGNIEQPQAVATQAPQLKRELVFPEENVNTLISIGYSRAEAVFALEMGEGDLARAVDYLYAPFPEE